MRKSKARLPSVRVFQDAREVERVGTANAAWAVQWREGGRKRQKTLGLKSAARAFSDQKQLQLLAVLQEKPVSEMLWLDFVEDYLRRLSEQGLRVQSVKTSKAVLKLFSTPCGRFTPPKKVADVTYGLLEDYIAARRRARGRKAGSTLALTSIAKELRTIRAALAVAAKQGIILKVPEKPGLRLDAAFQNWVRPDHFLRMLDHCNAANLPKHEPEAWWRGFLAILWATGLRKDSALRLRWEDAENTGLVTARAETLKQRMDWRGSIADVLPLLEPIRRQRGTILPWIAPGAIYRDFIRIQQAAGIHLECRIQGDHICSDSCHSYNLHDIRRSFATLSQDDLSLPKLMRCMGHRISATTLSYISPREGWPLDPAGYLEKWLQTDREGRESGGENREFQAAEPTQVLASQRVPVSSLHPTE